MYHIMLRVNDMERNQCCVKWLKKEPFKKTHNFDVGMFWFGTCPSPLPSDIQMSVIYSVLFRVDIRVAGIANSRIDSRVPGIPHTRLDKDILESYVSGIPQHRVYDAPTSMR